MYSKVNYALVGLFVVLLSAAAVGVAFWLTIGVQNKTYDRYRVYFHESVAGLSLKAAVRYRGVQVGQVESIRLDPSNPDQVDVVLDIERGTPIRRGTIATLSKQGLTGVASVELSGGGQSLPLEKQPGQGLPVIQAGPSLVARLDDAFNNIITNMDNLSRRLERLLGEDNQTALTQTLQNLSTITGAVADRSDRIRQTLDHVEVFAGALAGRATQLGKALDQLTTMLQGSGDWSTRLRATLSDFRAGAQAVRRTADTFDRTSRDLSGLAEVGQRELRRLGQNTVPEFNSLLVEANELVAVLRRLAELLEQNPRALVVGKPSGRPGPGEE
ncbi:MAG: MlaD family protein [Candidatus Competibacter sp.]|nr:MlaD family protein [Candidatus Competibacter sp.]MDG4584451.1 MlaD family protein [Candidatus Competibacter sp.]